MDRFPNSHNAIQYILSENIDVQTVLDVGVAAKTAFLQKAFPDKKHILFEPMVEFRDGCKISYEDKKIDYELHNVALSDIVDPDGRVFYNKHEGRKYIWSGVVPKGIEHYHGQVHPKRDIKIYTLDNFLADKKYKKPYYLKIDVDGGEMKVLEGAKNILKDCSVIQVEASLHKSQDQLVWNNLPWFQEQGFRLFDVVDMYYIDNYLWQIDLIFLNHTDYERIRNKSKKNWDDKQWQFLQ